MNYLERYEFWCNAGLPADVAAELKSIENNNEEVAPETPIANFGIYDVQLTYKSPLCGISMVEAKIPEKYSSMVIAIERNGEYLDQLNSIIFQPGDKVHFVGPKDTIHSLA